MTRDQAIRLIIDGTIFLEGEKSTIDVTLIREPDWPRKLERYYRQHGWITAEWRAYQMDDEGAGLFHLRRQGKGETEAAVLFERFNDSGRFNGSKKWEERKLLAGGLSTDLDELTCQLNTLFSSVPAEAVKGRKGWKVAKIAKTKELGTVLVVIRKTDPVQ